MSKPLFHQSEAHDWKPTRKPLSERQKRWIALAASPFALALIVFFLRADFVHVWRWIFSK